MKRLLVLRLSALGDVIHTIPAVVRLRETLPGTKISWVVEAPYRELVEVVAGVEAIPVRLRKWSRAPVASRREMGAALGAMRGSDESIDFQGLIKSAALGRLSGASTRHGFDRDAIREKPALYFNNRFIAVDTARHVVEQNLQLAAGVAGALAEATAAWERFPHDPEKRLASLAGAVVLLPGAGKPNKIWPSERFQELSRRLGARALAVWGPGEQELAEATGAQVAPPTNLRELAWLLRHAEVVIGGDTGPLHLAAALGTKVVGLYGPTDPRRNGPYGQLSRCIDRFSGESSNSAPPKSMESISVDDVMNVLERQGR